MTTKPLLYFGSLCEDGGSPQEKEMDECGAEVKLFSSKSQLPHLLKWEPRHTSRGCVDCVKKGHVRKALVQAPSKVLHKDSSDAFLLLIH